VLGKQKSGAKRWHLTFLSGVPNPRNTGPALSCFPALTRVFQQTTMVQVKQKIHHF
jgi:hypothetical protein